MCSCHHGDMARSDVADRKGLQIWRVAEDMLNKPISGGPSAWGLVEGLTTPHRKKEPVMIPLNNLGID